MNPPNKIILTPEQEQYLRENYATVIHHTLCQHLGVSTRTLVRMARARGLVKDMAAIEGQRGERISKSLKHLSVIGAIKITGPENGKASRFKPGFNAKELFGEEKFKEMHRKTVERRMQTFREERARVAFGLPQRTKLRVKRQPRQKIQDRYYLKKRGYILDETNNIAYYTADTHRATMLEERPKRFYTFKPYAEHQREQQDK